MFCKECSSLLADRCASQFDQEKLESINGEHDSEGEGPQIGSDIAYCLSELKKVILPGWTGYNTFLNSITIRVGDIYRYNRDSLSRLWF